MSYVVKIACMLMLTTSAFAEGNTFIDKSLPTVASAGTVATASATIPVQELPENERTVALILGIAAVAFTFHRDIFRGRQAA